MFDLLSRATRCARVTGLKARAHSETVWSRTSGVPLPTDVLVKLLMVRGRLYLSGPVNTVSE